MRRLILSACVVGSVAAVLTGCTSHHGTAPEQTAAQRYLTAFGGGDASGAAQATDEPGAADEAISASLAGLGKGSHGTLTVSGLTGRTKTVATANYRASWTLPGTPKTWTYDGTLPIAKQQDGSWLVDWQPDDVYPGLGAGEHLGVTHTQPARAALEDNAGKPLVTPTAIVNVGVNPALVKNLPSLANALATALARYQVTAADVTAAVKAAGPKAQFVPVITLRRTDYDQVRAVIHPLDGTVFTEDTALLGPTSRFAQPLLGHVGAATAQIVTKSAGAVTAGDEVGLDGLQRALDATLRGTPALDVHAVAADGTVGAKLATAVAATPGTPVKLTLDRTMQNAADGALATVPQQAAIVAMQPSTGKILAVANSAAAQGDIALAGQFPPGSTFKIVTMTAALAADPALRPDTVVPCPPTLAVDGFTLPNEDRFSVPGNKVTLREAFARSCNTTAAQLALKLPAAALPAAAKALGVGADWSALPVDAYSGSVPTPTSQFDQAEDAIGQGKVLASPLLMATVAGAASLGHPVPPSLVDGKQGTAGAAQPAARTSALEDLMRAVVAQPYGTAYALHDLPGALAGKTGTAEFGTAKPPPSHAWFAGVRGDLAFCVFVYGGESPSKTAVPVARAFLSALG